MNKILKLLGVLLLSALPCFAQSTTVSGQVTDAGGQSWNNGTVVASFVPNNPGTPTFNWTGGTFGLLQQTVSGVLNGTGGYSISVPSNTAITPSGSSWQIVVTSGTNPIATSTKIVTITGGTQTVNFTPAAISVSAGPGITAYADNEVGAGVGQTYYNLTSGLRVCTASSLGACTTWASAGGSGSGVSNVSGTVNQIDVATGTTTPVISLDAAITLPGSLTAPTGASITTSGTGTNNANRVNGATVPASSNNVVSNSSSQLIAGTSHNTSATLTCAAASGSGTAYTCSTSPTFVPVDGDIILFQADVANTGAATLVVNGQTGTPAINKQGGGTALVANDLIIGQDSLMEFDGINWQMQGQSGNAPSAGTVTSIATTSPITGGTITTTGTLACATCVTSAASLTNNVMVKGAGSQGTQTSLETDNGTTMTYTGAGGYSAPILVSTVAIGTPPLTVTSTTQVTNLNASQLVGATWIAPGTIGSTTPNTGSFTTLTANGVVTFSLSPAVSQPALLLNGTPQTGGSATTNFPLLYYGCNGATGPTTWATTGTILGFNPCTGFTGNVIDIHAVNGGVSNFSVSASGTMTAIGSVIAAKLVNNVGNKLWDSSTAPTIGTCGTSPSVTVQNGTAAFAVNVGTGGTATSCTVTMPAATTGWSCWIQPNGAPQAAAETFVVPTSTTVITFTNYTASTGAALAFASGAVFNLGCRGD